MATPLARKPSPELSKTRTNRDWIMIVLGIFLVLLFVVAGYFSYVPTKPAKGRGPVKDPTTNGRGSSTNQPAVPFRMGGNVIGISRSTS